jgi:hypothetical protein
MRGLPVVKVTEVSDGGGPEVSSTKTRASGSTLGATGATDSAGLSATEGLRPPQARTALIAETRSQVAPPTGPRDIAPIKEVRSES